MAPPPRPVDLFLDLALYLPVGFLLEARRVVPELAERGRTHVTQQVNLARFIGQFAVTKGQQELSRRVEGLLPTGPQAAGSPKANGTAAPRSTVEALPARVEASADDEAIEVLVVDERVDLPIEGYDALAASQVVSRLDDLGGDDLERVRAYETSHRGRRTILSKIARLQTS